MLHAQHSRPQIHVTPAKPEQLGQPETGRERGHEQRVEPLLPGCREYRGLFLGRERLLLCGDAADALDQPRDVAPHEATRLGLGERNP
jgi:hypothetical protein